MNQRGAKLKQKGFTLIELLMVIVVIGILASLVYTFSSTAKKRAYSARAFAELRNIAVATQSLASDQGSYPADVSRNLPPGIEEYLSNDDWPDAPWPGSVYDWDNFQNEGEQVYQISIRFCEIGQPSTCKFPDEEWAEDFDVNSSVYYCIQGTCKAHPNRPQDHPGYCVNCDN